MCLGVCGILLVVGREIIGCAAKALHRWRHFVSLCYVFWSKVEEDVRLSWTQCDALEIEGHRYFQRKLSPGVEENLSEQKPLLFR